MNKHISLILFMTLIICTTSVMALSTTDVGYTILVEYDEICTDVCVNNTIGNNTYYNCTIDCSGSELKVSGGEDTNHIGFITSLDELRIAKLYTGYKTAELGNQSDISSIAEDLAKWMEYEEKYNRCLDSNRNISTQLLFLQDDAGFKANFTECDKLREDATRELIDVRKDLADAEQEIEDNSSSKWLWLGIGALACFLFIKFGLPAIKGTSTPTAPSTTDIPPNPGY